MEKINQELKALLNNAHSPYSNVKVASIVVAANGKEYKGVNVENSSYGATICAERNAMLQAIADGNKAGDIKEVHIASNLGKPLYPCSICRQVMTELATSDTKVILHDQDKTITHTLKELVPHMVTKDSF